MLCAIVPSSSISSALLVGSLTRREHDQVNAKMAAEVGVPYADFWQLMGETYQDRCLGRYDTYEDLLWPISAPAYRRYGEYERHRAGR